MKASDVRKLKKRIDPAYSEMFSGRVYEVGEGAVSVRNHSGEARHTVIGVHGFLENHCYFTQLYQEPTTELILLTCSNYHIPVSGPNLEKPDWVMRNPYAVATIEYDARILVQALENLPCSRQVRVHGHSRGGGVILEAARQRPELFEHVDVVLEAPVMPRGQIHALTKAILEPVSHGMWPWIVRAINSTPSSAYGQTFFGRMNPRKKQLLTRMFAATQDHLTIVRNIENIMAWMENRGPELLSNIRQGTILIPETDRILDRDVMLEIARHLPTAVRIVETTNTSHFITLDSVEWAPSTDDIPRAA